MSNKEKLEKLLSLDAYEDFESAEHLADGYNELRDAITDFLNELFGED